MLYTLNLCSAVCQLHLNRSGSGEGDGTPLQCSGLENPMDGGAWSAAVHGVAKSRTWLSNFPFTFHFHALEKEMVTHSSVLAWRIPGMGKPGGLLSMGLHRVGHDWSDLAAAATAAILHCVYVPQRSYPFVCFLNFLKKSWRVGIFIFFQIHMRLSMSVAK